MARLTSFVTVEDVQRDGYGNDDERDENRFGVAGDESDDLPAVVCAQAGEDREPNGATDRERNEKLVARILHGAGGD